MLFFLATALAKESEFVDVELDEPVDSPEVQLSAEVGGAWSAGNTDSRTLSAKASTSYRWGANGVSSTGSAVLGSARMDQNADGVLDDAERRADRVKTAQRASAQLRYDRYLNAKTSIYTLGGGLNDPFAGYDARLNTQLGTSRLVVGDADDLDETQTRVVAELGFDAAHEDYAPGVDPETDWLYAARGEIALVQDLTEQLEVGETAEVFVNVRDPSDTRFISATAVTNELTDHLSVRFSYTFTYDTSPVHGYVATDHTGLVTLVAKVL